MSEKVAVVGGGIAGVGAAWSASPCGLRSRAIRKRPRSRWKRKDLSLDRRGRPCRVLRCSSLPGRGCTTTTMSRCWARLASVSTSYQSPTSCRPQRGTSAKTARRLCRSASPPEFRRWKRLVAFVTKVNDVFLPKNKHDSMYHFSYFNPMNLIPLYWLARLFGISNAFWDKILRSYSLRELHHDVDAQCPRGDSAFAREHRSSRGAHADGGLGRDRPVRFSTG